MPELPEIEHLKRSLEPVLIGATVLRVFAYRSDVIRHAGFAKAGNHSSNLLLGSEIQQLDRHGKQLAIVGNRKTALCIHLGMSGQCWLEPSSLKSRLNNESQRKNHIHCRWRISSSNGIYDLIFRDPRRFGGIWSFPSINDLIDLRWSQLGHDALTISTQNLRDAVRTTMRPIKSALLDQRIIAGVGNIYADESLFMSRIHPMTPGSLLSTDDVSTLARSVRQVLRQAVAAGGSTLRDYRDGNGSPGAYQQHHQVYGRGGQSCRRCQTPLLAIQVTQRTTVYCPRCQRLPRTKPLKRRTNSAGA